MPNRAKGSTLRDTWQSIHQAFAEFLAIPTFLIAAFILLSVLMCALDQATPNAVQSVREFLEHHAYSNGAATSQFLSTIAGGLLTVTSITFSLLLLAVLQSATSLTSQVFDQFLHRTLNQVYVGFFVGLTLYTLIILTTVNKPHNPVLGASLDLVLTLAALYLLILLLYSTINQIRPSQVVESIHDLTLRARRGQLPLMGRTRRSSQSPHPVQVTFCAPRYGYLSGVDLTVIQKALLPTDAEVELLESIGYFFAAGEPVAQIRAPSRQEAEKVHAALSSALRSRRSRSIRTDPSFGVEQLQIIGWTAVSTAKQNLAPGQLIIRLLRDLLVHWVSPNPLWDHQAAVVYPDTLLMQVFDTFEALGVISSPGDQYQITTEVVRTIASIFDSLPDLLQDRAEGVILRLLPTISSQPPATPLTKALCSLVDTLRHAGKHQTAGKVEQVVRRLECSIGQASTGASTTEG